MPGINCTLDYRCDGCSRRGGCSTCGWNAAVAGPRRAYLQQQGLDGLTLCPDGKRRLIIRRNVAVTATEDYAAPAGAADSAAEENAAPGCANSEDGEEKLHPHYNARMEACQYELT